MQYVILQHNKAVEFIDEKTMELMTAGMVQGAKGMKRKDGTFLPFSSIADTLTLDQYYAKYPEARPTLERTPEQIAADREKYKPIEFHASKRQQAFKGLLVGLKKFVEEEKSAKRNYTNALKMYQDKLKKYVQLFGGKDTRSELEKIAADFGGEVVG